MFGPGWHENRIYPSTHWLFYNQRGYYRARVDYGLWGKQYMWRVMRDMPGRDIVGWELTLEAAQKAAEDIMNGKPHQLQLLLGKASHEYLFYRSK